MYTASFLISNLTGSQIAVIQLNLDRLKEPDPDLELDDYLAVSHFYGEQTKDIESLIDKYCRENKEKRNKAFQGK